VKQENKDREPLVIDLLDISEDEIGDEESDDIKEKQDWKPKEELLAMPENQDNSHPGIMLIANNVPPIESPGWTVQQ
jgi:hypothetical protein